jgi:hypothetical protein
MGVDARWSPDRQGAGMNAHARAYTIGGLVVGAVGIGVLWCRGRVPDRNTPGIVILVAGALFVTSSVRTGCWAAAACHDPTAMRTTPATANTPSQNEDRAGTPLREALSAHSIEAIQAGSARSSK